VVYRKGPLHLGHVAPCRGGGGDDGSASLVSDTIGPRSETRFLSTKVDARYLQHMMGGTIPSADQDARRAGPEA
jgi:hypothetical protein